MGSGVLSGCGAAMAACNTSAGSGFDTINAYSTVEWCELACLREQPRLQAGMLVPYDR